MQQIVVPARLAFKEPLIEEAVRLSIGKEAGEKLTEADLLSVSEILIYGNKAAANAEIFNEYGNSFVNNDGTIQRGDITTLDDLKKLPNLRSISLVYQNISDLTPLAELTGLEYVDLRHNPIKDVTPLSNLLLLSNLSLFGTEVSDLTALRSCSRLIALDIGSTQVESTVALDGLESLQVLAIRKTPLRSLDHIETHLELKQVFLSETQVQDFAPLLELPNLELVEVSEDMRSAAELLADRAQFSIVYQ
jgi:Leucine-rich repeat (LRR) protein